ncbi:MAG: polysaccharide biosynthesis tyrosine autokinase [Eubacterium sp.]
MSDIQKVHTEKEYTEDTLELEMDLLTIASDMFKGLKKFWWTIPIMALMFSLCICYTEISSYVPLYKSEATFTISVQSDAGTNGQNESYSYYYNASTASQMATTFPYILSSDIFMDIIKEDLGTDVVNGSITATAVTDTNMFTITVTSNNPNDAYDILISVINNYPEIARYVIGETQMNMQLSPTVPQKPFNSINYSKGITYSIIIAFIIGLIIIFIYAITRKTIRVQKDIKIDLNQKLLGTITTVQFKKHSKGFDDSILITNPHIPDFFLEAIRQIKIRVLREMDYPGTKVITVTSNMNGEGKSIIAANLALEMAKNGKRVALLDGDLRRPSVKKVLNINPDENSLEDIFKRNNMENDLVINKKSGLIVIGAKSKIDNPAAKINSVQMKNLIEYLRNETDVVIIDTPPCGQIADFYELSKYSDGTVYVIKQDFVKKSQIIDSLYNMAATKVNIIGCVLNMAQVGLEGYGYGYYGKYGYYGRYGKYGKYGKYGYSRYGYSYGNISHRHNSKKTEAENTKSASEDKENILPDINS